MLIFYLFPIRCSFFYVIPPGFLYFKLYRDGHYKSIRQDIIYRPTTHPLTLKDIISISTIPIFSTVLYIHKSDGNIIIIIPIHIFICIVMRGRKNTKYITNRTICINKKNIHINRKTKTGY